MKKGYSQGSNKASLLVFILIFMSVNSLLAQLSVDVTSVDQDVQVPYSGSVSIDINSGTPPYTFYGFGDTIVFPGDTILDVDSLMAGTYPGMVIDSTQDTIDFDAEVLYGIAWRNEVGVTTTSSTVTRPVGGTWNAGAFSLNGLEPYEDGFLEFTVTSSSMLYSIGFAYNDYNTSYYSFKYAFYINQNSASMHIDGYRIAGTYAQSITVGDVLKIARVGDEIRYYKNETLLYTITNITDEDRHMFLDVSKCWAAAPISGIRASFDIPFNIDGTVTQLPLDGSASGAIDVSVFGGDAPYTYAWSDGPTTEDRSSLSPGDYTLTVTDNSSNTFVKKFTVGYEIEWTEEAIATSTNKSIMYTGTPYAFNYNWVAGGTSVNLLPAGEDGYIQFTVPFGANVGQAIGLSVGHNTYYPRHAKYSMYFNALTLIVYRNGVSEFSTNYSLGDVFRMERSGDNLLFYLEDVLLYTIALEDNDVDLNIDADFKSAGTAFENIVTSFGLAYDAYPIVTPCDIDQLESGAIDLNIQSGQSPYTVSWSDGGTGTSRTGLDAGVYTVTVVDDNSSSITKTITLGYKFKWTNEVNVAGYEDYVIKTGGSNWNYSFDAGCFSQNVLLPNTDGGFSLQQRETTAGDIYSYGIGLSKKDFSTSKGNIKYAFIVSVSTYSIYINGALVAGTQQPISIGDKLSMERIGSTMYYKKNGNIVYSHAVDPTETLHVDNSIRLYGSKITDLTTTMGRPFSAYPIIEDVDPVSPATGSIDLNVMGGAAPYTYLWSDANTLASRSNLDVGTYQVTITDDNGTTVSHTIDLLYEMKWTGLQNVAVDEHSVAKDGGSISLADGLAQSENILPANTDGYIEFDINSLNNKFYIGFSGSYFSPRYMGFRYGIYNPNNGFYINNHFVNVSTVFANGPADLIRISREGSTIKYYQNGVEIHSQAVDPNETLFLSIYMYSGSITNIRSSFGKPLGGYPTIVNDDANNPGTGSIALNFDGGVAPYSIQWADGSTDDTRTGLTAGLYDVTITDANATSCTETYGIYYGINWENEINVTTTEESIIKSSGGTAGWNGSANSVDKLLPYQNGYLEFEFPRYGTLLTMGLTENNAGYNTILYSFLLGGDNRPYIFENGSNLGTFGSVNFAGDIYKIERVGSEIKYYQNNILLRTVSTDPSKELMIDCSFRYYTVVPVRLRPTFGAPLDIASQITSVSADNPTNGSIDITVTGGFSPYTYAWSNSETTEDISGLSAGVYTLTVTDYLGNEHVSDHYVTGEIVWDNLSDIDASTANSITTTETSTWGASASSWNRLDESEEGFVAASGLSGNVWFGFSTVDLGHTPSSIRYGFRYLSGQLDAMHGDKVLANIGSIDAEDQLKIERTSSGNVVFYVNGGVEYTDTIIVDTSSLILDIDLGNSGQAGFIGASFFPPDYEIRVEVQGFLNAENSTTADLYIDVYGGTPPYTYSWSSGATTATATLTESGMYGVTVTDDNAVTATLTSPMPYMILWESETEVNTGIHSIRRNTSDADWDGGAYSATYLASGDDGFVFSPINTIDENGKYIGLSEADASFAYSDMDYAFFVDHGVLSIYENGSLVSTYGSVDIGDNIIIERSGSNIIYKHNDDILRTISTDNSKVLTLDVNLYGDAGFDVILTSLGSLSEENALYWTGDVSQDWSTVGNWSLYPCGPSSGTVPDASTIAIFVGCSNTQAQLSANATVTDIVYESGYSYLVDENGYTLTISGEVVVNGAAFTFNSGTYNLGDALNIQSGSITLTGATLEAATSITVAGGVLQGTGIIDAPNVSLESGSILAGTSLSIQGEVSVTGGSLSTDNNEILIDEGLTVSGGVVSIGSGNMEITDNLTVSGGVVLAQSGTLEISGGLVVNSGSFDGGTATIDVDGTLNGNGGTIKSTSNTLTVGGDFTCGAYIFDHNSGGVVFLGDTIDFVPDTLVDTNTLRISVGGGFNDLDLSTATQSKTLKHSLVVNGTLDLKDDDLIMQGNQLVINNTSASAIQTSSGSIIIGDADNAGKIKWQMNNATGIYTIPFTNTNSDDLSIEVDVSTGGTLEHSSEPGYLLIETYASDTDMEPIAGSVDHFYDDSGLEDLTTIAKRYWIVNTENYTTGPVADFSLKYSDTDITGLTGGEANLKPFEWNGTEWNLIIGSTANATLNENVFGRTFTGVVTTGTVVVLNTGLFGRPSRFVYGELKDKLDASYYQSHNNKAYFEYDNPFAQEDINIKLYGWDRSSAIQTWNVTAKPGANWLNVSLASLGLTEGSYYILEVSNGKGIVKKMRVKYKSNVVYPNDNSGYGQ